MNTRSVTPDELKPHPFNVRLFRQQTPGERFIRDIEERMEEPIIVNADSEIIDGIRRWLAAIEGDLEEVKAVQRTYDSVEDERLAILRHNDDRDETFTQKMRVAYEFENTIAPILEDRMKAGIDLAEQEEDPLLELAEGNIRARDLAADRVNWSGSKYNQAKQIWEAAHGDTDVANPVRERARSLIRAIEDPDDTTSVYSAYQTLRREKEHQELQGAVKQEALKDIGADEQFERLDETVASKRESLDKSTPWSELLDSLEDAYQKMWGKPPDDGASHCLLYQLEEQDLADLSEDEWSTVGSLVDRKPDRETLKEVYWDQEMSLTEVAIRYGVREEVVKYWLREEELARKKQDLNQSIREKLERRE